MIEELFKEFTDYKYFIGQGSLDWVDIKSDYELEDMAVAGSVSHWRHNSLKKIDLPKWNEDLKSFQVKLINYEPKDDLEKQEKEIISRRIEIGLKIFEELITIQEAGIKG